MNIRLDIHTHTIASGHAFSSLQEMAKAAADYAHNFEYVSVEVHVMFNAIRQYVVAEV